MSRSVHLKVTLGRFEILHQAADGAGKYASISRRDLVDLLADHSMMIGRMKDEGLEVTDGLNSPPIPPRVRKRTRA